MTTETTDPPLTACPDWCELDAGHDWEWGGGVEGPPGRDHTRTVARIVTHTPQQAYIEVLIVQVEHAGRGFDEAAVEVRHVRDVELDSADARALAIALLDAAGRVQDLNAQTSENNRSRS